MIKLIIFSFFIAFISSQNGRNGNIFRLTKDHKDIGQKKVVVYNGIRYPSRMKIKSGFAIVPPLDQTRKMLMINLSNFEIVQFYSSSMSLSKYVFASDIAILSDGRYRFVNGRYYNFDKRQITLFFYGGSLSKCQNLVNFTISSNSYTLVQQEQVIIFNEVHQKQLSYYFFSWSYISDYGIASWKIFQERQPNKIEEYASMQGQAVISAKMMSLNSIISYEFLLCQVNKINVDLFHNFRYYDVITFSFSLSFDQTLMLDAKYFNAKVYRWDEQNKFRLWKGWEIQIQYAQFFGGGIFMNNHETVVMIEQSKIRNVGRVLRFYSLVTDTYSNSTIQSIYFANNVNYFCSIEGKSLLFVVTTIPKRVLRVYRVINNQITEISSIELYLNDTYKMFQCIGNNSALIITNFLGRYTFYKYSLVNDVLSLNKEIQYNFSRATYGLKGTLNNLVVLTCSQGDWEDNRYLDDSLNLVNVTLPFPLGSRGNILQIRAEYILWNIRWADRYSDNYQITRYVQEENKIDYLSSFPRYKDILSSLSGYQHPFMYPKLNQFSFTSYNFTNGSKVIYFKIDQPAIKRLGVIHNGTNSCRGTSAYIQSTNNQEFIITYDYYSTKLQKYRIEEQIVKIDEVSLPLFEFRSVSWRGSTDELSIILWGKDLQSKQILSIRANNNLSIILFEERFDYNETIYDCDYDFSTKKIILRAKNQDNATMSIYLINNSENMSNEIMKERNHLVNLQQQ